MMKKLLTLSLATVGLGFGLIGCGVLDPEEATAPTISLQAIDTLTAGSGAAKTVTGTIKADSAISAVSYKIYNSSNTEVPASQISVSGTAANNKEDLSISVSIQALSGTAAGNYKLTISATAGLTASVDCPFYVKSGVVVTDLVEATVTLGGHSNTEVGSSVDLDDGTVMLAADAKLANSGADIVYTFSSILSSPVILTPAFAKDSSNIEAFSGWVSPNATQIQKLSNVDYDAIQTKAQVQALFTATTFPGRTPIAVGDVLVVKTDANAYILMEITSVSANAGGTASIKYAK